MAPRSAANFGIVLLGVCVIAACGPSTLARSLAQVALAPVADLSPVIEYTWHVTVSSQAPDCFQRDVLLVNGSFQPTLEVVQGSFLKVTFLLFLNTFNLVALSAQSMYCNTVHMCVLQ